MATIVGPLSFCWFTSGLYIVIWYSRTGHQGKPTSSAMIEAMFIGLPPAIWGAVALWWWLHRKTAVFSDMFLMQTRTITCDLGIGIIIACLWIVTYGILDFVSWHEMFTLDSAKLLSIPATLSAGFCEEALFRGFLFWKLKMAKMRRIIILIITSTAFGLAHCFWGPIGMLWTTVLGLTFGLVVLWRHNIWPVVVAHILLDLLIEPGLIEKALAGGFAT